MTPVSIITVMCCATPILGESGYNQGECVLTANYEAVLMEITAYCPGECCCGRWADGFTASGKRAEGLIVAAPKRFKFGTKIYIPSYGLATVEDRGGAITGNRIDVLLPTHEAALNWGRKQKMVVLFDL